MQIHQALFHIKKVISLKDCKKMISYMDKHCKTKAEVMSKHGKPITETKTRNVLSHWLNPNDYGAPPYFKIVENAVKEAMLEFSKHFKYVYSYEPNVFIFKRLRKLKKKNILAFNFGFGDQN